MSDKSKPRLHVGWSPSHSLPGTRVTTVYVNAHTCTPCLRSRRCIFAFSRRRTRHCCANQFASALCADPSASSLCSWTRKSSNSALYRCARAPQMGCHHASASAALHPAAASLRHTAAERMRAGLRICLLGEILPHLPLCLELQQLVFSCLDLATMRRGSRHDVRSQDLSRSFPYDSSLICSTVVIARIATFLPFVEILCLVVYYIHIYYTLRTNYVRHIGSAD